MSMATFAIIVGLPHYAYFVLSSAAKLFVSSAYSTLEVANQLLAAKAPLSPLILGWLETASNSRSSFLASIHFMGVVFKCRLNLASWFVMPQVPDAGPTDDGCLSISFSQFYCESRGGSSSAVQMPAVNFS